MFPRVIKIYCDSWSETQSGIITSIEWEPIPSFASHFLRHRVGERRKRKIILVTESTEISRIQTLNMILNLNIQANGSLVSLRYWHPCLEYGMQTSKAKWYFSQKRANIYHSRLNRPDSDFIKKSFSNENFFFQTFQVGEHGSDEWRRGRGVYSCY